MNGPKKKQNPFEESLDDDVSEPLDVDPPAEFNEPDMDDEDFDDFDETDEY